MYKIVRLFEDNMYDVEQKMIKELGMDASIEVIPSGTEDEIIENAKDADVIICVYEPLTKKVLENLKNLKMVIFRSIGFNGIDMDYANEINLPVSHTSKYCTDEVANYVVSAIVLHNRRILEFNKSVKVDRKWDCELFPDMRRLSSRTIGLIGFGNIPKLITKRLKAFGPEIVAYDPFVPDEVFEEYGVKRVDLETLFAQSDYISSHLPLNKQTEKSLNKSLFDLVKDGAVFINSSRGGVVDEEDLYEALTEGNLSYAILDVLSSENPDLSKAKLVDLDNVVVTPHIAFYSQDAFVQGAEDTMKNIHAFMNKEYKNAEIVNLRNIEL